MRLELKQTAGEPIRAGAEGCSFERGRKTLGRGVDCDWQAADPQRLLSKRHCTIERDRDGFVLRDQSANGSRVDSVTLHEGDTARLRDRSRIEIGGLAFSVSISGDPDLDLGDPDARLALSDEPLTISSILADVAPGGRTGNGILGRRGEDDLSDFPVVAPQKKTGARSSRNVEIGWSGPPSLAGMTGQILPDDWNTDFDSSNRYEHKSAPHVAVPAPRQDRTSRSSTAGETRAVPEETIAAVRTAREPALPAGMSASASAVVPASPGDVAALLHRIEQLLDRMGEAIDGAYTAFDLDPPVLIEEGDFLAAGREDMLFRHFNALIGHQIGLNQMLERLMRETGRMMEPRILEAKVDAEPRKLPWRSDRSYWRAYCAQFEKENRQLSLRELFRAAMLGQDESAQDTDTAGRTRPQT